MITRPTCVAHRRSGSRPTLLDRAVDRRKPARGGGPGVRRAARRATKGRGHAFSCAPPDPGNASGPGDPRPALVSLSALRLADTRAQPSVRSPPEQCHGAIHSRLTLRVLRRRSYTGRASCYENPGQAPDAQGTEPCPLPSRRRSSPRRRCARTRRLGNRQRCDIADDERHKHEYVQHADAAGVQRSSAWHRRPRGR